MSNAGRREAGIALVAALLFAVTVMAFVSAVVTSGVAVQGHARAVSSSQEAQAAAVSGVNLAVAYMSGPDRIMFLSGGGGQGVLRGSGERAPRFEVAVQLAGNDSADNDLDGLVDEEDEGDMVEIRSTGSYNGVTRTVRATLLARYVMPALGSASYIADPLADLSFGGNAFQISGYDVDLKGARTGRVVPGIGVEGSPAHLTEQIKKQQYGNVIGEGGNPSVREVPALDFTELIEQGARAANVTLKGDGATQKPETEGAWGTLDAPAVVFGTGSVHISSGSKGAGILVVDGDLVISGGFEWQGLVVVRGDLVFSGGGEGTRVIGSLVVEDNIGVETGNGVVTNSTVTLGGTVDVEFSLETIQHVRKAMAKYTVFNWREGPTPDAYLDGVGR